MDLSSFYCPITTALMENPVIDREGNSYEKEAITEWVNLNHSSPITRNPLQLSDLAPNRALKDAIDRAKSLGQVFPPNSTRPPVTSDSSDKLIQDSQSNIQVSISSFPLSKTALGLNAETEDLLVHCRIISTEESGSVKVPSDIVIVMDVSGSMCSSATAQGVEDSGLNLLDIVKHAARTIIYSLDERDRLSIVKFSTSASTVSPLIAMNATNKKYLEELLQPMQPSGSTNLWDGVKMGLNHLKAEKTKIHRNSVVLLLTDGEPTINPPRGNLSMLERYPEDGRYPGILSTFGFGYSLDSGLLRDMARLGGGMYAFIPDSGFVGTAFVHGLANSLVTNVTDCSLILMPRQGARFVPSLDLNESQHILNDDGSVTIKVGSLQYGQSRDFMKTISLDEGFDKSQPILDTIFQYRPVNQNELAPSIMTPAVLFSDFVDINQQYETDLQIFRLKLVSLLNDFMRRGLSSLDISAATLEVKSFIDEMKGWLSSHLDNSNPKAIEISAYQRIKDLLSDLEGQIVEGLSRDDWFKRWGRHYIPSICRAHELQQCNNFKDPGIQHYGGKIFGQVRDFADDAFGNLPPPEPSRVQSVMPPQPRGGIMHSLANSFSSFSAPSVLPAVSAPRVVDMSLYNMRYGGCMHGSCVTRLYDGTMKSLSELQRGDRLHNNDIIEIVVRSRCDESGLFPLVMMDNGLMITPWHPILLPGEKKWRFPADLVEAQDPSCQLMRISCDYVYNFITRREDSDGLSNEMSFGKSMSINGIECITLGHGITDDIVAKHEFYGTSRVVEVLHGCSEWVTGVITLNGHSAVRDPISGLVSNFLLESDCKEIIRSILQ